MTPEEFEQKLSKIDKKLDKCLHLMTLIAKTLHIVPVTEKEEREIQGLMSKNAAVVQKIQEEKATLEEKPKDEHSELNIFDLFTASKADIYGDIIGDEFDLQDN